MTADAAAARAGYLWDLGRYADAERVARAALADDPEHPRLLAELATALISQDREPEALPVSEALIAVRPEVPTGYRLRAIALYGSGRAEEAVTAARTAVGLDPHGAWTAAVHGHALLRAAVHGPAPRRAGRLAEAARETRRSLELDPSDADHHTLLADILDELRERDAARRSYREALRLDPEHARARHNLAVLELNASKLGAALDGLLDAGRLAPDNPKLMVNLGAALFNATIPLAIWLAVASVPLFLSDAGALPGWSTRALGGLVLLVGLAMCWPGAPAMRPRVRPVILASLRVDRELRLAYLCLLLLTVTVVVTAATGVAALAALMWPVSAAYGGLVYLARAKRLASRP